MPTASNLDILAAATNDILMALQKPNTNSPLEPLSDSETQALKQAVTVLHNKLPSQSLPPQQNTPKVTSNEPTTVPDPPLRVNKPHVQPTQPLRVETPASLRVTDKAPCPAPPLRVPTPTPTSTNTPTTTTAVPTVTPPTQDEQIAPPPTDPSDLYEFTHVMNHKPAPKGSGSKYQVKIAWKQHKPSYVPINIFTDHDTNITATEAVATYAKKNNPLTHKGWKRFKNNLPPMANHASFNNDCAPPKQLTHNQMNCFQDCHYAMLATQQANKAINPDTGKLSEYPTLLKSSDGNHWEESCCQEIGRLAQGYLPEMPQGTNTMHFIKFDQIPTGQKATYLCLVVADRPTKPNPCQVRFTVGGDRVDYPGEVSTKVADLPTAKLIINSTISTPEARFMGIDIKDFYLNNPMDHY